MLVLLIIFMGLVMVEGTLENTGRIWRDKPQKILRNLDWWEHTIIYEILVKSFKDSNGDGIGDFKGLISQLDHFVDAGIGTIWLTPIYSSPFVDLGYDISDFYNVNEELGTMGDFEELIDQAHKLGIKVILDFVPNHASTESAYFKCSEAREPGYENYFIWADPKQDPNNATKRLEPSNWISEFGSSMWQWSEKRQQYYLHQFAISQADFNFKDPAVRKEILNIIGYWLEKGVDGFRVDAVDYFYEVDPENFKGTYPDEPLSNNRYVPKNHSGHFHHNYTRYMPKSYEMLVEWRDYIDQWQKENNEETKILLSESFHKKSMNNYGSKSRKGAHLSFNFDIILSLSPESIAADYVYTILHWLTFMPNGHVANWVLANHDRPRIASKYGPQMVDGMNALIMILPGVAANYQGDEIGIRESVVTLEQTRDVYVKETGKLEYSRDPIRAPFQWNNSTSAGFSTNKTTWLPVAKDYITVNLCTQKEMERSHYKVYQSLTRLRNEPSLSHGFTHTQALTENTFIVIRFLETYPTYVLVFNVSSEPDEVDLSEAWMMEWPMIVCIASGHSTRKIGDPLPRGTVTLQPGEALVLSLPPS